jgi:steroid delta-isomerase
MTTQTEPLIPSPERIQASINQYFEATKSADRVEAMLACFAPDCVNRDPADGPVMEGHPEFRNYLTSVASLFSSAGLTAEYVSINGAQAAVKWIGHGTSHAGQSVSFEGIDLFEFNADAKIKSLVAYWNPAALMAELSSIQS